MLVSFAIWTRLCLNSTGGSNEEHFQTDRSAVEEIGPPITDGYRSDSAAVTNQFRVINKTLIVYRSIQAVRLREGEYRS